MQRPIGHPSSQIMAVPGLNPAKTATLSRPPAPPAPPGQAGLPGLPGPPRPPRPVESYPVDPIELRRRLYVVIAEREAAERQRLARLANHWTSTGTGILLQPSAAPDQDARVRAWVSNRWDVPPNRAGIQPPVQPQVQPQVQPEPQPNIRPKIEPSRNKAGLPLQRKAKSLSTLISPPISAVGGAPCFYQAPPTTGPQDQADWSQDCHAAIGEGDDGQARPKTAGSRRSIFRWSVGWGNLGSHPREDKAAPTPTNKAASTFGDKAASTLGDKVSSGKQRKSLKAIIFGRLSLRN